LALQPGLYFTLEPFIQHMAATRSKAIGAVQEVLRVDRFEQHRYRSLDDLSLARGCADWALTPVFLLDPDALDGRCLGASAAQTLMQIAQILVKVFGLRLRCDPVNARGTGLARVTVCLPQKSSSIREARIVHTRAESRAACATMR